MVDYQGVLMLKGSQKLLMNNDVPLEQINHKIFIKENELMARHLESAINEHFSSSTRTLGGKVHVSSLTYCLRKEVIKSHLITTGKNKPEDFMNIWTAMNFIRGLGSEAWFTKFIQDEIDAQVDMNHEMKVVAHPDAVTKDRKQIIEMKNSNTYVGLVLGDDNLKSYFRQTVYYMVMSGIEIGHVVVFYGLPMHLKYDNSWGGQTHYTSTNLQKNSERPFKIFTLNLARESTLRAKIKNGMSQAHAYINQQDFSDPNSIKNFPRIDNFYSEDKEKKWKCTYCDVYKICNKIEPEIEDPILSDILLNTLVDDNCMLIAGDPSDGTSVLKQPSIDSS
jgi:hypothetical protein